MEIFYATVLNMKGMAIFLAVISLLLAAAAIAIHSSIETDKILEKDDSPIPKTLLYVALVFGCTFWMCILFTLVPSPKDLWEVRIGLLKYNVVSQENIEKFVREGMPAIERITKKLECQYLGCEEKKNEQ